MTVKLAVARDSSIGLPCGSAELNLEYNSNVAALQRDPDVLAAGKEVVVDPADYRPVIPDALDPLQRKLGAGALHVSVHVALGHALHSGNFRLLS